MTAFATILALIPLAAGFNQGSIIAAELGTVVIGGLFSSTFLTLLVVPVVYSLVEGGKESLGRRLRRGQPEPALVPAVAVPSGVAMSAPTQMALADDDSAAPVVVEPVAPPPAALRPVKRSLPRRILRRLGSVLLAAADGRR
jgi:HAE1 family hydrophobic/amphiphilic exporter-1